MTESDSHYYELLHKKFCAQSPRRHYPKGAVVVTIGDQSDRVYCVVEGELKVAITDEEGKEVILNIIGAGESFGELAVLTGNPRSADVIARTACDLVLIHKRNFMQALQSDAELALAALQHHAQMVYCLTDQVSSLALVDVFGRVASHLLAHAREIDSRWVITGMTHQDIAAAIGASREMVSKILGDLKKGGYIDTQRKKITLLKPLPKAW